MSYKISVAILGSTGYAGLELVKILSKHENVKIVFLGTENTPNTSVKNFDNTIIDTNLPLTELNKNFDYKQVDTVFLALPHNVSHQYVKMCYGKIKIIDLSADFRLNNYDIYKENYGTGHSCPNLLENFTYGLADYNKKNLLGSNNIAVPGCYPTSILIPMMPLLVHNLIKVSNIIIDSKSGYSGAGKKFDLTNIKNQQDLNFYNYNTNNHRHICEIKQELEKKSNSKVSFSFNPHILPNFRGMMSTIYCDLLDNIKEDDVVKCFKEIDRNNYFIDLIPNDQRADFFGVQNTNKCIIKICKSNDKNKIIIVSLIDNLQKGASGQAVQCFNISNGFEENLGLN